MQKRADELPPIELHWFDTQRTIMEDGKALVETLASNFPKLRDKVRVTLHVDPWWKAAPAMEGQETSLVLVGHVLNEAPALLSPGVPSGRDFAFRALTSFWRNAQGGGVLIVEPAIRRASQLLSSVRDRLLEDEGDPSMIWGPCLHAGACPLAEGRDWCHFSVPVEIPGEWFQVFSRKLGSERQWVKFSYLWLAAESAPAPVSSPALRRVVSDPLRKGEATSSDVLICEPGQPGRLRVPASARVHRGDVVNPKKFSSRS
jgi:hypothetical protein